MGVPITFLNKHNPDQFEIVGADSWFAGKLGRFYVKGNIRICTDRYSAKGRNVRDFTLIVLAAIVANLLTPTVKYLWRCVARYFRRHYIWLDSTRRFIGNRHHWRKTGKLRKHMHRLLEIAASNLIDIEYIEWREAINKNNARLYRQSVRTAAGKDTHQQILKIA